MKGGVSLAVSTDFIGWSWLHFFFFRALFLVNMYTCYFTLMHFYMKQTGNREIFWVVWFSSFFAANDGGVNLTNFSVSLT